MDKLRLSEPVKGFLQSGVLGLVCILSLQAVSFMAPRGLQFAAVAGTSNVSVSTNCGPAALVAGGSNPFFFSSFDNVEYSPLGYLTYHFKNLLSDGRGFSFGLLLYDDQCNLSPLTIPSPFVPLSLPSGVTDWSARFTSDTHFDVWDDQHNVLISGFDIPQHPATYSILFQGTINAGANFFLSRTFTIGASSTMPVSEHWITFAPYPVIAANFPVAVVGGNIYVVGGPNFPFPNVPMQIYNPASDTWHTATGSSFSHANDIFTAGPDGRLYYFGGCSFSECSRAVHMYDPSTDTWSDSNPGPLVRSGAVGAFINGKLYITGGGYSQTGDPAQTLELDVFDLVTNTWTSGASVPFDVVNDIGGPTPGMRSSAMGVALNGKFYVIGGSGALGLLTNRVDVYDPATNTWSPDTPLPAPIASAAIGILNGKIHVVGGITQSLNGSTQTNVATNYSFDPITHVWSSDSPMTIARKSVFGAVIGSVLYVIGGSSASGIPSGLNEGFTEEPSAFQVSLWTQVQSDFPSQAQTATWANASYASGTDACGGQANNFVATIGRCGCLITSFVMLAHYYGIDTDIAGNPVTPLNMNSWLETNNGYDPNNNLIWDKALQYLGTLINGRINTRLQYEAVNGHSIITDAANIDNFLAQHNPAIFYNNSAGHYLVATSKLTNSQSATYALRDPFFYNTQTLNDAQNSSSHIHAYNNHFDFALIPTKLAQPQPLKRNTTLFLASPAEILVTEPQGNKEGKDPTTSTSYNQISGATYDIQVPILSSDVPLDSSTLHQTKVLRLPSLSNGTYNIQIIGTGSGTYQFTSAMTNDAGTTTVKVFTASTTPNAVGTYIFSVSTTSEKIVRAPGELILLLEQLIQSLNVKKDIKSDLLESVQKIKKAYQRSGHGDLTEVINEMVQDVNKLRRGKLSSVVADSILSVLADLKDAVALSSGNHRSSDSEHDE